MAWALTPQRIVHRGKEVCLEAFRPSLVEYRSIPLSIIRELGTEGSI